MTTHHDAWIRHGDITLPPPVDLGRLTRRRREACAALMGTLWDAHGRRRLPTVRALVAALEACDRRDPWWVCEATSAGPVYLLPTREWMRHLVRLLDRLGVRRVLEVGAGDGFLAECLARAGSGLHVTATDTHAWRRPRARMNAADRRVYRGVRFSGIRPGSNVKRLGAAAAITRFRPDLVLVSWPPPGTLVERAIRARTRWVLDLSVEGDVCGNGAATWRFNKEFLGGPLEDRALCRLDARPSEGRATRVTLYFGRAHPEFFEER
ncbi:MAG: hypothetical protein HY904_10570 [Deltaproteobacteria bacterium]|nr:hypothetical protein [Deltaproteobacteria bacterium]